MALKLFHTDRRLLVLETKHGDMWVSTDGNPVIRLRTGKYETTLDGAKYEIWDCKDFTKSSVKQLFGLE